MDSYGETAIDTPTETYMIGMSVLNNKCPLVFVCYNF